MYISLISYLKQRDNQTGIRNYSVNSFSRIRSVERPLISVLCCVIDFLSKVMDEMMVL